jgi:hypothetical protein
VQMGSSGGGDEVIDCRRRGWRRRCEAEISSEHRRMGLKLRNATSVADHVLWELPTWSTSARPAPAWHIGRSFPRLTLRTRVHYYQYSQTSISVRGSEHTFS